MPLVRQTNIPRRGNRQQLLPEDSPLANLTPFGIALETPVAMINAVKGDITTAITN
jgi:hypothetical protein